MRAAAWLLPVLALGLGACGGMSDEERFSLRTPGTDDPIVREIEGSEKLRRGKPTPAELRVIRAWADALRAGHVVEAANLFAVPALVADGASPKRRLADRAAILDFNRSLPCGAVLVDARRGEPSFVVATFRLTERPGAGKCGTGVGRLADTIFVVDRRHIVQWIRGADPVQPDNDES
jgi:hypothetical protein